MSSSKQDTSVKTDDTETKKQDRLKRLQDLRLRQVGYC